MPVKWHCPVVLSNARECFFSENGQTSLVTCIMTTVVKRMTCLILPRGPHLPWMGPVHPSPAPEFCTPRLPFIAVTAPRTTLPGRKLAVPGGLQKRVSIPAPTHPWSAVTAPRHRASGGLRGALSSLFPHLLLLPAYASGIPRGMWKRRGFPLNETALANCCLLFPSKSTTLLQEHPSSLGCFWVRCLI